MRGPSCDLYGCYCRGDDGVGLVGAMKSYLPLEITLSFDIPEDVEYEPEEKAGPYSPPRFSDATLKRAYIEEFRREATIDEIQAANDDACFRDALITTYEDKMSKEAEVQSMTSADCRFHAWQDDRRFT